MHRNIIIYVAIIARYNFYSNLSLNYYQGNYDNFELSEIPFTAGMINPNWSTDNYSDSPNAELTAVYLWLARY